MLLIAVNQSDDDGVQQNLSPEGGSRVDYLAVHSLKTGDVYRCSRLVQMREHFTIIKLGAADIGHGGPIRWARLSTAGSSVSCGNQLGMMDVR